MLGACLRCAKSLALLTVSSPSLKWMAPAAYVAGLHDTASGVVPGAPRGRHSWSEPVAKITRNQGVSPAISVPVLNTDTPADHLGYDLHALVRQPPIAKVPLTVQSFIR